MAHGYAKIEGKLMIPAWRRYTARRASARWFAITREWDDQPYSLGHSAESAVRAYGIAMTPPMAPC